MKKKQSLLSAAIMAAVFVVPGVNAQVEVVESNNRLISDPVVSAMPLQASPDTASAPAGGTAEMFYQMQMLQQEVSQLRGLVEEQTYEIKRLKQQRLDDYLSLDKRLSAVAGGAFSDASKSLAASATQSSAVNTATSTPVTSSAQSLPSEPSGTQESQQYRAAIDLILKQKDYAKAEVALNQYLQQFPKGRYAANSLYWLGELALLKGDLEKSREWFARMVSEWPEHNKVADANYKLGTVYHKLGDTVKAQSILQEVAAGDSNAARLAKSYLANNF
ncbi:MAG: tol-pal system protein YbgF [Candidatus Pelagadaptatus aseana]|uniref:tol-pal system protein YbgF n=1 Tax=Candidatus Pelagadaptatus aseana TaxID=3120508 RepID=UPI0039B2AE82